MVLNLMQLFRKRVRDARHQSLSEQFAQGLFHDQFFVGDNEQQPLAMVTPFLSGVARHLQGNGPIFAEIDPFVTLHLAGTFVFTAQFLDQRLCAVRGAGVANDVVRNEGRDGRETTSQHLRLVLDNHVQTNLRWLLRVFLRWLLRLFFRFVLHLSFVGDLRLLEGFVFLY